MQTRHSVYYTNHTSFKVYYLKANYIIISIKFNAFITFKLSSRSSFYHVQGWSNYFLSCKCRNAMVCPGCSMWQLVEIMAFNYCQNVLKHKTWSSASEESVDLPFIAHPWIQDWTVRSVECRRVCPGKSMREKNRWSYIIRDQTSRFDLPSKITLIIIDK